MAAGGSARETRRLSSSPSDRKRGLWRRCHRPCRGSSSSSSRRPSSGRRRAQDSGHNRARERRRRPGSDSSGLRGSCRSAGARWRPAVGEADRRPGLSPVPRSVHAVAVGDVRAHVGLARASVEDLRVRRRDRDRPDRGNGLRVEDRFPRATGVLAFPDSAADRPEIEMFGLLWSVRRGMGRRGASACRQRARGRKAAPRLPTPPRRA